MTTDCLSASEKNDFEDAVHSYLSEIRSFPRLSAEEERELACRCAAGDEDAIRRMVDCNLRLVVSMARQYAGRGVAMMDLVQEGSIGLLMAAKKYDPTLDFRFSTYATKWIHRGISRCFSGVTTIRVPDHTLEKIRKLLAARRELTVKLGEEPSLSELAEYCRLDEERVKQLLSLSPEVCSLDSPVGEDDSTLGQFLEDNREPQPFETLVREELNLALQSLLSMLDERQRKIVHLRFGFEDGSCHSYAEIAEVIGVSRERVRQIEKQAMDKLHEKGLDIGLEDFLG